MIAPRLSLLPEVISHVTSHEASLILVEVYNGYRVLPQSYAIMNARLEMGKELKV